MAPADDEAGPGPPYTPAEVAALENVDERTVRDWIDRGVLVAGRRVKLAGYKVGGVRRVSRAAHAAFVRDCNPGGVPTPPPDPAADARRGRQSQRHLAGLLGDG